MMFNEFNRRMSHTNLNEDAKYLLTHMFEVQVEMNKQLDIMTTVVNALADTVQKVVQLHENTHHKLKQLAEFGKTPGVEVHSVRNEPDDN